VPRLVRPSRIAGLFVACCLAALLVAGCGGGGDGTESSEAGTPGIDYAVDISKVDVKECPADLFLGNDWKVLIEGNEVLAYCGRATGTVDVVGGKPVKITNGHCELGREGVVMNGGFINQEFEAPEKFRRDLPILTISLGRFGGEGAPVTRDGTYVDPIGGKVDIEITAGGSGIFSNILDFEHKITVVLSNDRTRATFTAEPKDANDPNFPRVGGTFDCHAEIFRTE